MGYTLLDDEAPKKGYTLIDEPKKGTGSYALDAGNAVGTGYFNGLTRLAGLPVDTIANVRDLLKAGGGSAYIAATGKAPPSWLEVGDRSNDIGSGDQMIAAAKKTKAGQALLDPINPAFQNGYAQTMGMGLTGISSPRSLVQGVNQGINSVGGAVAGKAVYDATGNTALAIAAGMSPTALQSAGTEALKYGVRGGEQGRREMAQRIQDLKNAGVDNPTMGLASGNSTIGGIENLLQSTPGAVNIMRNARDGAVQGLEQKLAGAVDMASANRGSTASGVSIQRGATSFRDDVKARQADLYNRLDQFIPGMSPTEVGGTRSALTALNADIPTMPALSNFFKNKTIGALQGALDNDLSGTPAIPPSTIPFTSRQVVGTDAAGMPVYKNVTIPMQSPGIPAGPDRTTAPFTAVKQTRTLVGNEIADTNLASSVPRSKWNPLYAALSDDLQTAANAAGPDATRTFNRATDYTRNSIGRLDAIDPIVSRATPEGTYNALQGTLKDNPSLFQAVKKSLPEGARGDFAGTVIERLGTAAAGQQDHTGGKFSTETFLTNWNKMGDKGKSELLSGFPNSAQVRADVEAVAKATSMMRDNSKIWANPSGTGANIAARGYLGLLGGSLLTPLSPTLIGAAAALPTSANLGARFLTNKNMVNSMASQSYIDPQMLDAQFRSLVGGGLLSQP